MRLCVLTRSSWEGRRKVLIGKFCCWKEDKVIKIRWKVLFFKLYHRAVLPPHAHPTLLNPQNRPKTIFVYKDALNSWSPASASQGPRLQMWWGIKPGALYVLGKHWTTELHPHTHHTHHTRAHVHVYRVFPVVLIKMTSEPYACYVLSFLIPANSPV